MVSPYLPTLYRRARGLTGKRADAQDVSQETVLKAWSRLGQFAGKQERSDRRFSRLDLAHCGQHFDRFIAPAP